ncbi:hypothetical protein MJO55_11645 [Mycolicibacterium rufum]|uniref:Uncharacterized protein n=1 Tax=Mycolicibacterium rufum TaxID=318424 RepID=A0ABY3UHA7_9MYCO|nr:hypothetical protein [Mycolicibacterium rufum]ULP38998.1 hypothetical protein MJO55_11645 [Mycolicibacterium rufum]
MASPVEPVVLAEHGGMVVAERGAEIVVIDRGNGPAEITAFVLGVLTLVFVGFGVVAVIAGVRGAATAQFAVIGGAILVSGIGFGAALVFTVAALRRRRRRPLASFTPVAVFDRAHRVYRDGTGAAIAPLDQVRFERRMQRTSSSPKLVAVTPSDVRILKRGNPFGGGIGSLDTILTHAVFGR